MGGGGGVSKNRKTNHAQEKKEKKIGTQGSMGKPFYLYAGLTYFWDLYNGDVRKKSTSESYSNEKC